MSDSHIHAVTDLINQLGHKATSEDVARRFDKLKNAKGNGFFVIVGTTASNAQPLAYLHVQEHQSLHYKDSVEVVALVTHERHRGQGLATKLMKHAEDWARARQLPCVWLRSNVTRPVAHAFYKGIGYELISSSHKFEKILD